MVIFPYPKPTKCYGDTVIRRASVSNDVVSCVGSLSVVCR